MRFRIGLALAVLIATACSVGVDGPVAVESPDVAPSLDRDGVKPPPPIGSGDLEIDMFSPSSETESEGLVASGPSASTLGNLSFSASLHGRYFANTQSTNGWIQFTSEDCVVASPGAKLQYDEKTGKTHGHGTITNCEGVTIDLSKIEITSGGFGGCELNPYSEKYECRNFFFSYDGITGGSVFTTPGD